MEYGETFNSMASFIDACSKREPNKPWSGKPRCSQSDGDEEWSGAIDFASAVDIAYCGYPNAVREISADLERKAKKLFKRIEQRRARPRNSYVGGSPNVNRAIMGLPRDMRSMEKSGKKAAGIELVYDAGISWRVTESEALEAGARMLTLVRLCERAKTPVRLTVCSHLKIQQREYELNIIVKDFGKAVNLQKIAYALAHRSFVRRLTFAWIETSPIIKGYDECYGTPLNGDRERIEAARKRYAKNGKYFFCFNDMGNDNAVVAAWEKINER